MQIFGDMMGASIIMPRFIIVILLSPILIFQKSEDWETSPGIDMTTERAFFSMVSTKNSLFAIGGYNKNGFLKSIGIV